MTKRQTADSTVNLKLIGNEPVYGVYSLETGTVGYISTSMFSMEHQMDDGDSLIEFCAKPVRVVPREEYCDEQ